MNIVFKASSIPSTVRPEVAVILKELKNMINLSANDTQEEDSPVNTLLKITVSQEISET